jgi:hypothetical protein
MSSWFMDLLPQLTIISCAVLKSKPRTENSLYLGVLFQKHTVFFYMETVYICDLESKQINLLDLHMCPIKWELEC